MTRLLIHRYRPYNKELTRKHLAPPPLRSTLYIPEHQVLLSGVFYPIESMPELIQPIAKILPLSFVSTAMRERANNGASLLLIAPSLFGIALWFVIAFILATRLFVWKEVAN